MKLMKLQCIYSDAVFTRDIPAEEIKSSYVFTIPAQTINFDCHYLRQAK